MVANLFHTRTHFFYFQNTICEHEIRNINCACQDADDLSHFAYITKDSDNDTHYCHVFNVVSMVRNFVSLLKHKLMISTPRINCNKL